MPDDQSLLVEFIFLFVLILINAFFAASEIAIVSLNRNKIEYLAEKGSKNASRLLLLLEEPSQFLATIQIGITLGGFFASASAAVSISDKLSNWLKSFNIPYLAASIDEISIFIVTIILSFFTLVLGELVPKRLALHHSEKIALFTVGPILAISKITIPFVKVLTFSTNIILLLFGVKDSRTEEKVTEEEIRMMIDVGEENGVINETEKEMIDGILRFDNILVREVMTPRTRIFALDINTSIQDAFNVIIQEQYSRIPVYEENVDEIVGILYLKDLLSVFQSQDTSNSIKGLLRAAYFVPETKHIDQLFRELQSSQNHIAIVVDEYGGVSGLITIEDLLEEIVGNIADEHDEQIELHDITKLDNSTYLINGLVNIHTLNEALDLELPVEHYDTVGGFVMSLMGKVPEENENYIVEHKNLVIKVEKVQDKRIEQVKIYIN